MDFVLYPVYLTKDPARRAAVQGTTPLRRGLPIV